MLTEQTARLMPGLFCKWKLWQTDANPTWKEQKTFTYKL